MYVQPYPVLGQDVPKLTAPPIGIEEVLSRIAAPGQEEISVSEAGRYAIAYEYQSVLDGQVVTAPETMPAMNIAVIRVDTKAPVALGTTSGRSERRTVTPWSGSRR